MSRLFCVAVSMVLALSALSGRGRARTAADGLFVEGAAAAGLTFTHVNGANGRYYLPEVMGAGGAVARLPNSPIQASRLKSSLTNICRTLISPVS